MTALLGLAIAASLWWWLKAFGKADPGRLALVAKRGGGVLALVAAVILGMRGRLDMAALLAAGGAWLLGWSALPQVWPFTLFASRDAASRHRLGVLDAHFDPRTGAWSGTVLAGPLAGRLLEELGTPDLLSLREACLGGGNLDAALLIEAHLDRRAPGWREHAHPHGDARGRADLQRGPMSEQEAHEILGLEPGAQPEAVAAAHRNLIKRLHPDGGGSTWLASRVNLAKDVLLSRHR